MFYISEIHKDAPTEFKTPLQKETYKALDEKLDMKMVKTLFLCNRKKTLFFIFVTCGDKSFNSSAFSQAMNCSRVSFAPEELFFEMLGTKIGAATVFSAMKDLDGDIHVVIDEDVAKEEYYGCSDGTTTCYLKIKTTDIIEKFLPYAKHRAHIISI